MVDRPKTRGSTRSKVYFCQPCDARHGPPTGTLCTRANSERDESEDDRVPELPNEGRVATKRPAPKKRGRKPRSMSSSDKPPQNLTREGESQSSESSGGAQPHDSGLQLILSQLRSIREEVATAREEDRRETQKAIDALAERLDVPTLSSDEEACVQPNEARATASRPAKRAKATAEPEQSGPQPFACPVRGGDVSGGASITPEMVQNALDPIARLKGDRISSAQAQLIMSAVVGQDTEGETSNIESGYYRTLNDIKKYHVPWPNDTIYRSNGKKALYDSLSISEFVMGYCNIIASTLKVGTETAQAFDHISYLIHILQFQFASLVFFQISYFWSIFTKFYSWRFYYQSGSAC